MALQDGKHTILTFTQAGANYTLLGWVYSEFDVIMLQLIVGDISAANPEVLVSYIMDPSKQTSGESLQQYVGRILVAFNTEMMNKFGGATVPAEPPQFWYEKLWEVLKTITLVRDASGTPQLKL